VKGWGVMAKAAGCRVVNDARALPFGAVWFLAVGKPENWIC
jgi:hypothetical protein